MTREDIKKLFPDATDEQITTLLNQHQGELATERGKANKYKADADKVSELQAKISEMEGANLSDLEKANKATETANTKIAELEKQIARMTMKNSLAEQGIIGEDADKLLESLNSGTFDASILGQIIKARETAAVSAFEKQKMSQTPSGAGASGAGNQEKPADVKVAEMLTFGSAGESAKAARDYYA